MKAVPQTKTCPRCGASFECFAEEDCWCEGVQLHRAQFVRLAYDYTDCLCPECLKEYSSD